MNSRIKLLLVSLSLVLVGLPRVAAADDGTITVAPSAPSEDSSSGKRESKRGQSMLDQRLEQLDKNLQLSAEQKEQIKAIWVKEATAAKGGQGKDRRAALLETRDQVRAVLTPDQRVKFDKMDGQRRAPGGKSKKAK